VGVLARYVHGALAVLLLPALSFALWLGTLSLLILAAGLFTVAHIQGWSARHEKEYREIDDEERVSSAFLDELRIEGSILEAPVGHSPFGEGASSSVSRAMAGRVAGFLLSGMLAVALVSDIGCATAVKSAQVPETDS